MPQVTSNCMRSTPSEIDNELWRTMSEPDIDPKLADGLGSNAEFAKWWVRQVLPSVELDELLETKPNLTREKDSWSAQSRAARETGCRICLGGKMTGYEGIEPGVIEEARFALEFDKPLYLMGGFGGATRWFGEKSADKSIDYWEKSNGLDENNKRELFETTDVERALRLIRAGIHASNEWHKA